MWKRSRTREYCIPEDPNFQQHSCGTSCLTIMILQVQLNQDISILSVYVLRYGLLLFRHFTLNEYRDSDDVLLLTPWVLYSFEDNCSLFVISCNLCLPSCILSESALFAWSSYINFWDAAEKQTSSYLRRCWVLKSHTSTHYDNSPPIFLALYSWSFGSFVLYRIVKLHILPAISLFTSRTGVQLNLQEVLCLYQHNLFKKIL
jgi:hypothetical protein